MASRTDGTEVPHAVALDLWAPVAYALLQDTARTYNAVVSYEELAAKVQSETGVSTRMLLPNWIGQMLEKVAEMAAQASEPPLTSLCVHADGTIGSGYDEAPKASGASSAADIENRAAEDRLACYRRYAADLPPDGGHSTLTPEVAFARRDRSDETWLEELLDRGRLTVADRTPFRTHVEVARLFGRDYGSHQRARIELDAATEVWFPKMYANDDWENTLSADGQIIAMQHVPGGRFGNAAALDDRPRYAITFGHMKPSDRPRHYRFLGVFEHAPQLSNDQRFVRQRVADVLTFDGAGVFDFSVTRTRPVSDDATAEASAPDPRLMSEARKQLAAGDFFVPDQQRMSNVRGSYQAAFAERVKDNYGWACAVTGITTREFLVASHIVPWSEDPRIRLDPSNGVCLSTFVDRAFDAGFLRITPEARTAVRWDKVGDDPLLKLELRRIDDIELARPVANAPDRRKLRRRLELGY